MKFCSYKDIEGETLLKYELSTQLYHSLLSFYDIILHKKKRIVAMTKRAGLN